MWPIGRTLISSSAQALGKQTFHSGEAGAQYAQNAPKTPRRQPRIRLRGESGMVSSDPKAQPMSTPPVVAA
jgi:hypothetical protein